jgi:hypothetical protein
MKLMILGLSTALAIKTLAAYYRFIPPKNVYKIAEIMEDRLPLLSSRINSSHKHRPTHENIP